jgi:putative restriction endonuclease
LLCVLYCVPRRSVRKTCSGHGNARQRTEALKAIKLRRGQKAFRNSLLKAHPQGCQVTGCNVASVLEAAHIKSYRGDDDNHVSNGLLLRTDIHTLFDLDLLRIEPVSLRIRLDDSLRDTDYWDSFGEAVLRIDGVVPHEEALAGRWGGC